MIRDILLYLLDLLDAPEVDPRPYADQIDGPGFALGMLFVGAVLALAFLLAVQP